MNVDERNQLAKKFIKDKLKLVSGRVEKDFKSLKDYQILKDTLGKLIDVQAMGFRGIVATAITGKYLNPKYDPLNEFYECNPRSIFENGIFYAFEEEKIPCGKSDPLNVAKNISILDDAWAKGKRPQSAAQAAVSYLKHIEAATEEEEKKVIDYFFFRLAQYAKEVGSIKISIPQEQEWASQIFASKLIKFFINYPESGATPQFIISKLLNKVYENSEITVCGGDESVFGTNTTSKKPADIWLEINDKPFNLYEVTVKSIDKKRLDDSIQCLRNVNMIDLPISFLCRLPIAVESLKNMEDFTLNYKGKVFNFVDIVGFTYSLSSLLSIDQIDKTLSDIREYVTQFNRPKKTKDGWNQIFN
jgi:hypothetical protein